MECGWERLGGYFLFFFTIFFTKSLYGKKNVILLRYEKIENLGFGKYGELHRNGTDRAEGVQMEW